jgi:hypothetical protein
MQGHNCCVAAASKLKKHIDLLVGQCNNYVILSVRQLQEQDKTQNTKLTRTNTERKKKK